MTHTIQILRQGGVEQTLALEPGTYSIGRSPASAIVLSDPAISKNHAVLEIDDQGCRITDTGSSNGIYVNGSRITEHRFTKGSLVQAGPFTLREVRETSAEGQTLKSGFMKRLGGIGVANIRLSLFVMMGFIMLMTLFIGYRPLKRQVAEIHRQELLRTGILLTRYLAEMNRPFLEDGQHNRVRVSPVSQEDGMVYAYVLDAYGRIIAPHEQQGNFLEWTGLAQAFQSAQLTMIDGNDGEKLIFYPIRHQTGIIGAALTGYAYRQLARQHTSGIGGAATLFLVILFIVAMIMAWFLSRSFLKPIKTLNSRMEIAIKENRTHIDIKAPFPELADLVQNINRLLIKQAEIQRSSPADTPRAIVVPPQSAQPADTPPPLSPEFRKETPQDNHEASELRDPWFAIDPESFTLTGVSETFLALPWAGDLRAGMHMIEAFDADMIQAISELLDARDDETATVHADGRACCLTRIGSQGDSGPVLLTLKEM